MEYEIDEEDFTALPVPNWPDEEEADQIVEASEAVELGESGEAGSWTGVGVEESSSIPDAVVVMGLVGLAALAFVFVGGNQNGSRE